MSLKIVVVLIAALGLLTLIALDSTQETGPHGGIVKKAEDYNIEMKNDPDTSFYAYLLDKKLQTISNKGITGEAKFFFPDSTIMGVELKPVKENAFTAKTIPGFYACKITFDVYGKSVSAQFDKPSQMVLTK